MGRDALKEAMEGAPAPADPPPRTEGSRSPIRTLTVLSEIRHSYVEHHLGIICLCQKQTPPGVLFNGIVSPSFHVKWTNFWKHPHFTISDFDET